MGDHTEAISIDFDPTVISYEQLLTHFWNGHRCEYNNSSQQYMNAIFYQNDEQKKIAEASLIKRAKLLRMTASEVKTKILPVRQFTYAEAYHQKYYLGRQGDLRSFLSKTYPSSKALADSTVATRLNAFLGSGKSKNWNQFAKELPNYGLPEGLEAEVQKTAQRKR